MKRIPFVAFLVFATLAFFAQPALAQVTITPGPDAANFARDVLQTDVGSLQLQLQSQVNQLFQVSNSTSFLRNFQDAQSFSSKGLGVDYASEATYVEVGATASVASNIDKAYKPSGSYADPPISGGGANFSLMGGLGLGVIGFDPMMLFANWFKGSATLGQLDGDYHNWGLHAQLRLFGPSRKTSATSFLVRWGGIAITSGADYSHLSLRAKKGISSSINVGSLLGGTAPVAVTSTGDVTFTVEQTTWTVPLEITTSLRLLSLLTVYGGIGLDWQLGGGSDMNINMTANLRSGAYSYLGTATVAASQHVSPSHTRMREIVGLQLSLLDIVRVFFQANVSGSSPMLTSLAAGARLAY